MKRKKIIKFIGQTLLILAMIGFLYYMFKDSYKEIFAQLKQVDGRLFFLAVILGNAYYFVDAYVYWSSLRREKIKVNFLRCVAISYLSIFFNVTTFGVGIKPAQVAYLHRKGVDAGKAFGILSAPFVFSKAAIIIYAVVMLLLNNSFVLNNFADSFGYIYAGVGMSLFIITVIILVCSAKWFHKFIGIILDFIFTKGKLAKYNYNVTFKAQLEKLYDASVLIIRRPLMWLKYVPINLLRNSLWYLIPTIGIYALGGNLGDVTFGQALAVTALMQLLVGAIPTSAGVGALEVVFSLLFAAIFGKVMAGSCMIFYRLATYYIPFIISIAVLFILEYDLRNVNSE